MIGLDGKFHWWFGAVEDRNDPLKIGRVRVRVFGLHTANRSVLPTDSLPWAYVIQPITSAANSGIGYSPTGILESTHVFGFWADGDNMQMPIVLGTMAGIPTQAGNSEGIKDVGFNDPNGVYPKEANQPDTDKLARGESTGTIIEAKNVTRVQNIPSGLISSFSEPESSYNAKYPKNHVYTSESGHVQEFDDTPGHERIHLFHRSGTSMEFGPDGSLVERVVKDNYQVVLGDDYIYVKGTANVTVDGNVLVNVLGSAEVVVGGNLNAKVTGDVNFKADGSAVIASQGEMILWSGDHITLEAPYIDWAPDGGVNPNKLAPILDQTKVDHDTQPDTADVDKGIDPDVYQQSLDRSGATAPVVTGESDPSNPADLTPPTLDPNDTVTEWDYSMDLGGGYTLNDLTRGAVFPHSLKAQHGLKEIDIVNNLKLVVKHLVIPMANQYGRDRIQINSGFRQGSTGSQHELGKAVDIQIPGFTTADYYDASKWVRDNIAYDQFILEFGGKKPWYHLSFNTAGLRRQVLSRVSPGVYKSGLIKVV